MSEVKPEAAPSEPNDVAPRAEHDGEAPPHLGAASGPEPRLSDESSDSAGERSADLKERAVVPVLPEYQPNYVFLGALAAVTLVLDLGTKIWAKTHLEDAKSFTDRHVEVIANHLAFTFAKNRGGAWGIFGDEPESVRRPLFLVISALAAAFIISLYRKLTPRQWALKWGLPLVLGGAAGNVVNRLQYNYVVDFIDYRADWMHSLNALIARLMGHPDAFVSDHWPTFNVADIAIVAGVVLMAVDMFTPTPKVPAASPSPAAPAPLPPAGEGSS